MKLFRLSLSHIMGYLRSNPLTFFLFFVGTMLSCFVFLYFYGNALRPNGYQEENSLEYRVFEVGFPQNTPITAEKISVLDSFGIEEVQMMCHVNLPTEYQTSVPDQTRVELCAVRENGTALGQTLFSKEQLRGEGILADKIYGNAVTQLTINGRVFPVWGNVDNGSGILFTPFDTYMHHFHEATYLMFLTKTVLSPEEIVAAGRLLETTFPSMDGYLAPDIIMQADADQRQDDILNAGLLYLAALLSFLFLFQFLLSSLQREAGIYRLVGASKGTLFVLLLGEVLCLAIVSAGCTVFLHQVFYDPFFSKLNQTEAYLPYSLTDYLFVILGASVLSILASLPFLAHFLHHTPIEGRHRDTK